MKTTLRLVLLLCFAISFGQSNLLDTSTWTVGNGDAPGFNTKDADANNVRQMGYGPHSTTDQVLLWTSVADAQAGSTYDGGWATDRHDIVQNQSYRLTVWLKKTNSNSGYTLYGFNALDASNNHASLNADGTANNNPYFFAWDDPDNLDTWYLFVGYVHPQGYNGPDLGGIYDQQGTKVAVLPDFRFSPVAAKIRHRVYLYSDPNVNDRQYYYDPTIYEVNGQEPTIAQLITSSSDAVAGGPGNTGTGATVWSQSGTDIHYNGGNVGIGTLNPGAYKLAVNGKIRAKEVKVETSWADYVFAQDYELPSLREVEEHIREKGHLINIPSAAEVEANGVQLGEMNKLLLEKIEELTLYILEQNKIQQTLEKRVRKLEKQQ